MFILALVCALLSGCGVKPGSPDAPDPHSNFPHPYPDPATDPGAKMSR